MSSYKTEKLGLHTWAPTDNVKRTEFNENFNIIENTQAQNQASINDINTKITNIGSASPKGTYATLTALQTAFPSGTTGIYLVTADGKWYYWSGTTWTAGGTYQATQITDNTITGVKLMEGAAVQLTNGLSPTKVPDNTININIQANSAINNIKTNVRDDLSIIADNGYGSFYNFTSDGGVSTGNGISNSRTSFSYTAIPEKMTKYTDSDLAAVINHPVNTNTALTSDNFTYAMITKKIDHVLDDDQTYIIEVMSDVDTPALYLQLFTAMNSSDNITAAVKSTVKSGVVLKAGELYTIAVTLPGISGTMPKWAKFCLYRAGDIQTAYNLTVSRMVVVKGKRRIAQMPVTIKEKALITSANLSTVTIDNLTSLKPVIATDSFILDRSLLQENFVHSDTNWATEPNIPNTYSVGSITNTTPDPLYKTLTGRVEEISYFTSTSAAGVYGHFWRYATFPTGATKIQLFLRMMLKDADTTTKNIRIFMRFFKSGDLWNTPSSDTYQTITLTKGVPYTGILEWTVPTGFTPVSVRFGVYNIKATASEVITIQHEAMGAFYDVNKYDIMRLPYGVADMGKFSTSTVTGTPTHQYLNHHALSKTNFIHSDTDWNTDPISTSTRFSVTSAINTAASPLWKNPTTGRVMEVDMYKTPTAGSYSYIFNTVNYPAEGVTKIQMLVRAMLKDSITPTQDLRLVIRVFDQDDPWNSPSKDIFQTITLTNNVPYTGVVEFVIPAPTAGQSWNYLRYGWWNLRPDTTTPMVVQFDALGIYYDVNKDDILINPYTITDIKNIGGGGSTNTVGSTPVTDIIVPKYIYTVSNDIGTPYKAREYTAALYLDHMVKTADTSDRFSDYPGGEGDKYYFVSPVDQSGANPIGNNGQNLVVTTKSIAIQSNKYSYPTQTVTHRSVKTSLSKSKYPKVLFIGDSITAAAGASATYGNGDYAYWAYVRKFFEMDRIDGGNNGNEYNFMSLGANNWQSLAINYGGVSKTVNVSAAGIGGWTLANFLHNTSMIRPSQATWDLLGLGNGSGTDYTGTLDQKALIAKTNQNDPAAVPQNHFFDNNKSGPIKFSIEKWLSRYRTRDDAGNKLTMTDPAKGSLITSQGMLDQYDVCTPTHVVIQHGRNDYGQYSATQPMIDNLNWLIADLKNSIPNVVIIICLTPDTGGTFFRDRYPQVIGDIGKLSGGRMEWQGAKDLMTNFGNMESQNVYISPNYFVQPTALGYVLQEIDMPEALDTAGTLQYASRKYRAVMDYPDSHNGTPAHATWGYQIYSLLKYQLSL
jgi:hypothetical protein